MLNQPFTADAAHQVWMAEITYIGTDEGWLVLASILDLCTRKVVGWHVDERMTKELAIQALEKAVQRERPKGGVLHHSDRGSPYASHEDQKRLLAYGMKSSTSRKGNGCDHACVESFHSLLKKELVYQEQFRTREEAKRRLFEYIEIFYNRQRFHSALGYQTPVEYEHKFVNLALFSSIGCVYSLDRGPDVENATTAVYQVSLENRPGPVHALFLCAPSYR